MKYLLIVMVSMACWLAYAEPAKDATWTSPETARAEDADFSIQGEYGQDTAGGAWGLQVIAMGNGQFDAYALEGGLPGVGWDKTRRRVKLTGKTADGKTVLTGAPGLQAEIVGGKATLTIAEATVTLPRIERHSATEGAKAPEGAIVLFDGSSADAWTNGQIENGLLMSNGSPTTKELFGSYTLHAEFRTPYTPSARGQGRGNSGIYHQGRFETQVLDAFGLEGNDNETGGIYGIAVPRLNMCLPPLSWQTYDVDFTAGAFVDGKKTTLAKITVRLNGVLIHENQELPKATAASPRPDGPEGGPIYLQDHGNPVRYRNIWIVKKN